MVGLALQAQPAEDQVRECVATEEVLVIDGEQRQLVWSLEATSAVRGHIVGLECEFYFEFFHERDEEDLLERRCSSCDIDLHNASARLAPISGRPDRAHSVDSVLNHQ